MSISSKSGFKFAPTGILRKMTNIYTEVPSAHLIIKRIFFVDKFINKCKRVLVLESFLLEVSQSIQPNNLCKLIFLNSD